jgi:hypothetical protein
VGALPIDSEAIRGFTGTSAYSLATESEDIAALPPASLLGYKTDYKSTGYRNPKEKALRNSLLRKAL